MSTKIFAHRGVRKHYPENTMDAFRAADTMGLDGIELDVQRTLDGVLVICHDEHLLELAGKDLWIKDLTWEKLSLINIAWHLQDGSTARIPTLQAFLQWLKTTTLIVNIELKNSIVPYEGMEGEVLALIDQYHLRDRVIISSFNLESVVHMKAIAPDIDVGFLYQRLKPLADRLVKDVGLDAIHPLYVHQLFCHLMWSARKKGLKVRVWTVNHPFFIRNALWRKVDTIMTDDPELVLALRAKYQSRRK